MKRSNSEKHTTKSQSSSSKQGKRLKQEEQENQPQIELTLFDPTNTSDQEWEKMAEFLRNM